MSPRRRRWIGLAARVTLTAAEAQREKIFEQETLALCLLIFERLFPVYNKTAGFEELKQSISDIIKQQEGQNFLDTLRSKLAWGLDIRSSRPGFQAG